MMNRIFKNFIILSVGFLAACQPNAQPTQAVGSINTGSPLVLSSVAPLHKITQALTVNTSIRVENIPTKARSMASQATLFSRQAERYEQQFLEADAVITMGKLWPEDSLYTTAREANIRVVNIDATKPWSHVLSGVAISSSPVSGEVSPYFWTSPSNAIRMLNIVARDLQTLYPQQADLISNNLENEKEFYRNLKSDFETEFIEVVDPIVFALADEFTYLTSDLGIFVDAYFIKQDIDWTKEDLANLTSRLQQSNIKVVIHKWKPSEEIQQAISITGAQLLVLDLMETSDADFRVSMKNNLESILAVMLAVSD